MENPNNSQKNKYWYLLILGLAIIVVLVGIYLKYSQTLPWSDSGGLINNSHLPIFSDKDLNKFEKFKSDEELKSYISSTQTNQNYPSLMMGRAEMKIAQSDTMALSVPGTAVQDSSSFNQEIPERVSSTNVQVLGIDEPDIVKTNGSELYYSSYFRGPNIIPEPPMILNDSGVSSDVIFEKRMIAPDYISNNSTKSFQIFPTDSMKTISNIPLYGEMVLSKDNLVIFHEEYNPSNKRGIYGYDISDPSKPEKKWDIVFKDNTFKVQARLYQKKLYVITRTSTDINKPCPLIPFQLQSQSISIPCTEIYHPLTPVNSDSVYMISRIDVSSGEVEKNISFVGSSGESIVYMSKDSLFITYFYNGDFLKIFNNFIAENSDIFPSIISQKLIALQGYEISSEAKMTEFNIIMNKYLSSLDQDKRLTFENNLNNRVKDYMKKQSRNLEKTGIVRISVNNLSVEAVGNVSGKPLNQFSLDEYENHLRIATTIGNNSWFGQFGGNNTESFSDVYVLNDRLNVVGSVKDLGKTERIYSARFIQDKGYVVTFRQTDPFYVIDLSNPGNPHLSGELKIPGYSSYLHPFTKDIILGIGKENQNVKLSLFQVNDPKNPLEIDKFMMDEYWSEALNNHHAFLVDEQKQIFFIPGSKGGYVFSYKNNKLSLIKAFGGVNAKRAVYVNDILYVVTDNSIIAIDENSWERLKELTIE